MQYVNLHNHTVYSDGINTIEENIESAIEKGMYALGFSDHSYTPCDESYCMMLRDYSPYLRELSELKEKYKGKIRIYAGVAIPPDLTTAWLPFTTLCETERLTLSTTALPSKWRAVKRFLAVISWQWQSATTISW